MGDADNRRQLKSRGTRWAQTAARAAIASGLSPNAISVIGIGFALLGAGAMLLTSQDRWWWLAAALGIQLRLLANMLDGLVAIEGGRGSATGALFNEVPDRIEDSALLIAAGYAAFVPALGWLAALLAIVTAYVRLLGGTLGFAQDFRGPMAKQHRMAVLTLAAIASAFVADSRVMAAALLLIVSGSALTAVLRLRRIATGLKAR